MFRVGQKVVCISGPLFPLNALCKNQPAVNRVYTVRHVRPPYKATNLGLAILLDEIVNGIHPESGEEYGFFASRFRPLVERKTSIEIFQKMLTPNKREKAMEDGR